MMENNEKQAVNGELADKLERMREIIRPLGRVAVAFSAGADSTLVLKVAADELGTENVIAVTGHSSSLASAEYDETCRIAETMGVRHEVIDTQEMDDPNYLANPANRCYFCKTELYGRMAETLERFELSAVLNGANADDVGDWRPGMQAAAEHRVVSPALDAGLTKADIRALSASMGLPTWDKPATPCLSSRVAYGVAITSEILGRIEEAESFLRSLGLRELRCRYHDGGLARIEVPEDRISDLASSATREAIINRLREIGFTFVTLDLSGFRSGNLNQTLVQIGEISPVSAETS
jgi:uncharacterized protein